MKILDGMTVCYDCKSVFDGITADLECPECKSGRILMLANSAVFETVTEESKDCDCPNFYDGVCELIGENVFEE